MSMLDQFSLSGRSAMVTGAATGLGHALAVGLAQAGADIVAVYHRQPPEAVVQAVQATGRRCIALQADLSNPASISTLMQQATAAMSTIDILVNNAGIIRRADFADFTSADWDDVMNVNLKSVFLLSQAVVRSMIARGQGGKIIHIASMLSFQGGIRVASYTASKHGIMGLTRLMANELAGKGINVNAIAPGYMVTDNTKALREDPKRNTDILARIPAGRWGQPEDLAGTAVYLASKASNYLHGATIPVDGGWLSR